MKEREFYPHRFKRHEWLGVQTKMQLVQELRQHQKEFRLEKWTVEDIRHFLGIHIELYPDEGPREHHIRCIATITRGRLI